MFRFLLGIAVTCESTYILIFFTHKEQSVQTMCGIHLFILLPHAGNVRLHRFTAHFMGGENLVGQGFLMFVH